jgi:hypothetical protein
MDPDQDKTINLNMDTGCTQGQHYSQTFNSDPRTFPPFHGWVRHSTVGKQYLMALTYMPDATFAKTGPDDILKEVRVL